MSSDNWPVNRIPIDVHYDEDDTRGADEIEVEQGFDIPLRNPFGTLSLVGLILHIIGWVLAIVAAIILISSYPQSWELAYEWESGSVLTEESQSLWDHWANAEEVQWAKERFTILGLLGAAFVFVGLALYQYGRAFRGAEDEAVLSKGVVGNA